MEAWLAIPEGRRPSRILPLCSSMAMLFLSLIYSHGQSRPANGVQPAALAER
jgi:hypothetical protein